MDLDGYIPFRSEVRLGAGLAALVTVQLQPLTSYRSVRGRRLFTWIVGAFAVAAMGTSWASASAPSGSRTRAD